MEINNLLVGYYNLHSIANSSVNFMFHRSSRSFELRSENGRSPKNYNSFVGEILFCHCIDSRAEIQ